MQCRCTRGVALPRFYRHLSQEEHDAIGGAHASTSATSGYGGIYEGGGAVGTGAPTP